MSIVDALLPEFDREMGLTRRLLQRLPDGQFAWKPHEKSMTLGRLAEHLTEMPMWCMVAIVQQGVDAASGHPDGYRSPATRDEILALFDKNVTDGRATLIGRTDAELMAPWTLRMAGRELFTMPKAAVLRNFVMNHLVHHRGQMSVYLRMHNVPIPSMYGPSADEPL